MTPNDIDKKQRAQVRLCEREVFSLLDQGRDLFIAMFPHAMVKSKAADQQSEAEKVWDYKCRQMKVWVHKTLTDAIATSQSAEPLDLVPQPARLPLAICRSLLSTLLQIFTTGRDLTDNDYYYISDVTGALGLEPKEAQKIIDQVQYEMRRDFFEILKHDLDDEQCFQCAVLLLKAIRADDHVHPLEFKYIENINQLLKHDQSLVEDVEDSAGVEGDFPRVFLPNEVASYMFKYLCEVVMCDGEYDARESEFLQAVGDAFGFDKHKQDEVIQPVAAALMVKAALFPKS